ncbi:mucin-12-like isoform X2 [Mytilus californianus]|uniref:mucin-12-like isoform X2 n=1 Tax=Mytilus californianus TaxID=6549 RepID=UPI002246B915|nr:mucin-12-like isoform X2 [Mytilus californianus]
MPIQREVIVAIGVGAATCGCYFIYKQITRHYSLVEPGGTENDASGSADFFESAEIKEQEGNTSEQRTFHRSEGHLSDHHPVNSGSDTEQGTSYGTSGEDNCINCNASQSNKPEDDGYLISRQTVLKKANDLGDNHVNSHHESLQDNHLTNTSNLRQLLDNSKLDSCSANPTPQKYASLNFEKSMMPCNDKDLEKEKEFDGQKPDVTDIQSVQMEGNANQNQKWPALQLNQPDLTVDSETHGPPERSFPETMLDDSPTTTSTPVEKSMMPCNDKDLEKEKEFDGQKPDVTDIQSVQMEGNANQNQKWPALQLNQPDLTVDSETHGPPERSFPETMLDDSPTTTSTPETHGPPERSFPETMLDDSPMTTSTPANGRRFTYQGSKDSTSSLSSQHSLEMDIEPHGPSGRMSVSEYRHVLNETIPDSTIEEPFLPANSFRYSEFPGLSLREEETLLSTSSYTSQASNQIPFDHNIPQSTQTQNTHSVSPAHHIIQSQVVQEENVASHISQPEKPQSSELLQPCISAMNISEPSPQLPTISPETSLPPAGSTTRDLSIKNTNQNITVSSVQNPIVRTNDNNLDTGQGQSDNDPTVTESVVDNESNESTSEYGTMTSNSDNLSPNLDDQSYTDNVTPEVQEVNYRRSDTNPECKTSLPMADAEPGTGTDKSVPEQVETASGQNDEKDITDVTDAVILHAEDDRELVLELIQNMETEFPELKLNLKIFEELNAGKSMLASAPLLFGTCRFLFVFVTKKFAQDELPRFVNEILLMETITFKDKSSRLIPVLKDDCYLPELSPLIPLKYNRYLEGKSQNKKDRGFLNSFEKLVKIGRTNYLKS